VVERALGDTGDTAGHAAVVPRLRIVYFERTFIVVAEGWGDRREAALRRLAPGTPQSVSSSRKRG